MPTPPGAFIWYELMTTDLDAAARFYGQVVGWHIGERATAGERDYRMILRDDGGNAGGALQLSAEMQQGGAFPQWMTYLAVPDVAATSKAIEADGGRVHMRMALPVGDIAMVSDPWGAVFYLMRPVPPPGQPDAVSDVFDPAATQRVRWNELSTLDVPRAKEFYAKHFGFAYTGAMPMGNLGDYTFFEHGGVPTGALMPQLPGHPLGWLFYFGVPSVMAASRAIAAGGGEVLQPPHEVPGGSWILVARDPQGAVFGVVGPRGE